ncbi:MAG: hypothetical protein PHT77_10260 [Bacteroidales bacterium]|jgi:hypothetical protein|nr:hypothetical protein [Bacteroidales bacterium]
MRQSIDQLLKLQAQAKRKPQVRLAPTTSLADFIERPELSFPTSKIGENSDTIPMVSGYPDLGPAKPKAYSANDIWNSILGQEKQSAEEIARQQRRAAASSMVNSFGNLAKALFSAYGASVGAPISQIQSTTPADQTRMDRLWELERSQKAKANTEKLQLMLDDLRYGRSLEESLRRFDQQKELQESQFIQQDKQNENYLTRLDRQNENMIARQYLQNKQIWDRQRDLEELRNKNRDNNQKPEKVPDVKYEIEIEGPDGKTYGLTKAQYNRKVQELKEKGGMFIDKKDEESAVMSDLYQSIKKSQPSRGYARFTQSLMNTLGDPGFSKLTREQQKYLLKKESADKKGYVPEFNKIGMDEYFEYIDAIVDDFYDKQSTTAKQKK